MTVRWTQARIKQQVYEDFGVHLGEDDAREIQQGKRHNTVTWNTECLTNVASTADIQRIDAYHVKTRGGVYTVQEFNASRGYVEDEPDFDAIEALLERNIKARQGK